MWSGLGRAFWRPQFAGSYQCGLCPLSVARFIRAHVNAQWQAGPTKAACGSEWYPIARPAVRDHSTMRTASCTNNTVVDAPGRQYLGQAHRKLARLSPSLSLIGLHSTHTYARPNHQFQHPTLSMHLLAGLLHSDQLM